jgi:hypothetical protein
MEHQDDEPVDFQTLYPEMPAEELAEAEQNFDLYTDDALLMYDRIRKDPLAYQKFRKTVADRTPSFFASPHFSNPSMLLNSYCGSEKTRRLRQ